MQLENDLEMQWKEKVVPETFKEKESKENVVPGEILLRKRQK